MKVFFNKPVYFPECESALRSCLQSGHLSGIGMYTKNCETWLREKTKSNVKIVSSATHALEMMGLLLEVQPGDEVILPSYTFSSTANAFAIRGAKLKFADNDLYGNIIPSEIERLYTKKTKAVMVMHYAGASADMEELQHYCERLKLPLVEDAAQVLGATYKGKALGTFGVFGCYSFHDTKNFSSGEGGALIINHSDFDDRAEILREKGTNRQKFFQGLVDKYTWVDIGSSYVLSDLNASYLWPQFESFEKIQNRRKQVWKRYESELKNVFEKLGARVLETPTYNQSNHHLFAAVFESAKRRNHFIQLMREKEISCSFHYIPLHTSPQGKKYYDGQEPEFLKGCEDLSNGIVRLPLYYNLTDDEVRYVIESAKKLSF